LRIENYGLIGDMQTAALVGRDGSVDWLCLPRFDSASCFSALLGDDRHGRWRLAPTGDVRTSARRYRAGTLVLETDFETDEGAARVIDFMPRRGEGPPRLMRIVEGLRGRVPARCMAAREYSLAVEGELSGQVRDQAELPAQRISTLGLTDLSASTIDENDFGPETVDASTGAVAGTQS
jgi:GH15 family glucan-1,4-alpha-glucosidase